MRNALAIIFFTAVGMSLVQPCEAARRYPAYRHTVVTKKFLENDAMRRILLDVRAPRRGKIRNGPPSGPPTNDQAAMSARPMVSGGRRMASAEQPPGPPTYSFGAPRLSNHAWKTLPLPKIFAGDAPQAMSNRRVTPLAAARRMASAATAASVIATPLPANVIEVREIGMGRFDPESCTLRAFIFTFDYDGSTAALLHEHAVLATPAQAAAAHLPERMPAC